jgi:hypothetical protein
MDLFNDSLLEEGWCVNFWVSPPCELDSEHFLESLAPLGILSKILSG